MSFYSCLAVQADDNSQYFVCCRIDGRNKEHGRNRFEGQHPEDGHWLEISVQWTEEADGHDEERGQRERYDNSWRRLKHQAPIP